MTRTKTMRVMCLFLLLTGTYLFSALPTFGTTPVRHLLNWIPLPYHVGFFVAQEKGFYTKEGLDVTFISGQGSGYAAKGVASGTVEMGTSDAGSVVVGRSQGLPAKMVGMFYDRSPMVIFVLKDSGIDGPKDLVGKTLAANVGSAPRVVFPAFARINDIDPASVKWLTIKPAAEVPTLIQGLADGIPTFSIVKPSFDKAAAQAGGNKQVKMIWYADHGLDIYGLAIISSDAWVQSHPEAVRSYLKATYEGIRWAMEHPSEAMKIFVTKHTGHSHEAGLKQWEMAQQLMITASTRKNGLGYMEPEKVKFTRDILAKYQGAKKEVETEELYTNEFLSKIFPPN